MIVMDEMWPVPPLAFAAAVENMRKNVARMYPSEQDKRADQAATIAWLQWEARAYVPRHLYRRPSPDALIGQFIDREVIR